MKTLSKIFVILTLMFVFACGPAVLKKEELNSWFTTISGNSPHTLNIDGKWRDAKGNFVFGWGEGYLRQKGNQVTGVIGNYNIQGVVSGDTVYLVFLSGGHVYYTARLEMLEKDMLMGNYFEAYDKSQENGYPTSFAKIK